MSTDTINQALQTANGTIVAHIDAIEATIKERTALKYERDELLMLQDQIRVARERELAASFVTEGNKTFLVEDDGTRVPMVADQRKDWVAQQVAASEEYASFGRRISEKSRRISELDDEYTVLHMRYRAAVIDAEGQIAMLRSAMA